MCFSSTMWRSFGMKDPWRNDEWWVLLCIIYQQLIFMPSYAPKSHWYCCTIKWCNQITIHYFPCSLSFSLNKSVFLCVLLNTTECAWISILIQVRRVFSFSSISTEFQSIEFASYLFILYHLCINTNLQNSFIALILWMMMDAFLR